MSIMYTNFIFLIIVKKNNILIVKVERDINDFSHAT